MTEAPKQIWARVRHDWHDGETGEHFVGGQFDAGQFKDGTQYVRADTHDALVKAADELADTVWLQENATGVNLIEHVRSRNMVSDALTAYKKARGETQ